MLNIPEYDIHHEDSLVVINEEDAISRSEAERFDKELIRIAGLNKFGTPNLVRRWGATYRDPMSTDTESIKYLDFTHKGVQLGERRHFIEIHRTPEFLVKSGRYRNLHDSDEVQEFYLCKACGTELKLINGAIEGKPETYVEPCPCGSKRNALRQVRTMGQGQLLQPFPEHGCYDYWLRLERANLTYHPADGEALEVIRALWQWELTPQGKRDAIEQANREMERRREIQMLRQQTPTRLHFGSGLIIPARFQ